MVEMHECVPGKRFDRYHELGQHAFGEKLGLWIVLSQLPDFVLSQLPYFIMIFASVHFVLSQLPDFHSISSVSLAAAVMSVSYSAIAWIASAVHGTSATAATEADWPSTPQAASIAA